MASARQDGVSDYPWKKMEDESLGQALLQVKSGKIGTFSCLMLDTVLGPGPFWRITDFEQAVLDGKPLAAGPEVSLGELRTALAIYRSAKTRQWEKVWE